jgi:threonyl-tRNA synthetase
MTYVGADGKEHQVVMIHRALLGAVERFFAILTEHCKGNFPVWLAPIQVAVLPVGSDFIEYAREVETKLLTCGIRTKIDDAPSTISYKIRQAELQKVPYMAIIGKREVETKKIAVRKHGSGSLGSLTIQALLKLISEESIQ